MKTIIKFVILLSVLLFATQCLAQFGNTNGTKFPYTNGLSRNDVFLIGTPGVTNKNVAASNILQSISAINTASLPTFTNGSAVIGHNNIILGSNTVNIAYVSNSFIAAIDMSLNFTNLDECIWIGMKPNSGGMEGPGAIAIGSGAGAYPYSVMIGNQSDLFSPFSEAVGVTLGINNSTNSISMGYGNGWDDKSSVHVFGSSYGNVDVTERTSYYGTRAGTGQFPTTTNHIFQGKLTADASGLTNIANANVVKAGTGITITTNTTAGTGTKEFTVALSGSGAGTNLWMQKDGSNWTNALNADILWSSAGPTSQQLTLGANDYINNGAQRWRASPGLEVGTGTYAIQGSGTSGGLSEGDGSMRVWHTVSNYVSGGVTIGGTLGVTGASTFGTATTDSLRYNGSTNAMMWADSNGFLRPTNNAVGLTNLFGLYATNSPSSNTVLRATSTSTAEWTTPASGGSVGSEYMITNEINRVFVMTNTSPTGAAVSNLTFISANKFAQTNSARYVEITNGTISASGTVTIGGAVTIDGASVINNNLNVAGGGILTHSAIRTGLSKKTGNATIGWTSDSGCTVKATTNVTLSIAPDSNRSGSTYYVKNIGTGMVIITNIDDTTTRFDGQTSAVLTNQYDSLMLLNDGGAGATNIWILHRSHVP